MATDIPPLDGPLRVLLLEDSADDAALITRVLRRRFGTVHANRVDTPEALRAALADSRWDVTISDHSMPRLGLATAAATLRAGGFQGPFVLCTGALRAELEAEARANGVRACLDKRELARLPALLQGLLASPGADAPATDWAGVSDERLRTGALTDAPGAWAELLRRHTEALRAGGRAGLYGHGGPTDDDSIDEAVARAWRRVLAEDMRNLREWDPERGSLGARFFGLALRVGWGLARQEHRRNAHKAPEVAPDRPDTRTAQPDEIVAARELSRFVRAWLAAQDADVARLLWLRREGRSVREIATRLHSSASAVHRRLQGIERQLVAVLEAHGWQCPRRG